VTTDSGAAVAGGGGVIHDIGYRHYTGQRLGRPAIVWALFAHSLRSAYGLGRGAKAKIVPFALFALMCLPAIVNAIIVATPGGRSQIHYDTYVFQLRVLVMIIFLASQAPEMVSRDLRNHVLPLYMSRPMTRLDYPLAKFAAFGTACLLILDLPLVLLYLGNIISASGGSGVWSQTRALIPGLLIGLMWAVVLAAIGLALASFTGRRAYATGTIAICFFLTFILSSILRQIPAQGPVAVPPGSPFIPAAPLGARLAGLLNPFTVFDGVRQWLGGTSPSPFPPPGSVGFVYGLMALLLLGASLGVLAARYRKAGA
jgi:ABC-2 type transport system permease protein